MRRVLRWMGFAAAGVLGLLALFAGYVYFASSLALRRTYETEAHPVQVPHDSASIAEGGRLARVLGCYGACHGDTAGGQVIDEPLLAQGAIPDLTRVVREYDDAQLERAIRHGIKPNGRSVVEFMPSEMFRHLSDEDLGVVIAFLRSLPPADGPAGGIRFKPLARTMMALGKIGFAAEGIPQPVTHPVPDRSDPIAFGRYLALTRCTECHGSALRGANLGVIGARSPDLRIAAAYSLEQFTRLLRTGVALEDRKMDLMARVARGRFSHFTDAEIHALHGYLRSLARAPATP